MMRMVGFVDRFDTQNRYSSNSTISAEFEVRRPTYVHGSVLPSRIEFSSLLTLTENGFGLQPLKSRDTHGNSLGDESTSIKHHESLPF
jgi:hypothetical protein